MLATRAAGGVPARLDLEDPPMPAAHPMEDPYSDDDNLSGEDFGESAELGKGKDKGPSPAQRLVEIALNEYDLVRTPDARTYAVPKAGGHALAVASKKGLRAVLAITLHRRFGIVPSGSALSDCLMVLEGEAASLPKQEVYLRMGAHQGQIVVDLGTATGHVVLVTPDGWRIEGKSPIIFRRTDVTLAYPEPVRGGTLDQLRALVNLTESDFRLAVGWVVCAFFEGFGHPILFIQGEQGTAKSHLMRTLLALIDPQPAAERTLPSDKREWGIFGRASWALGFDNVTNIQDMSDALCKGATGEAVFQRELHSDEDIILFAFRRVLALTTIALKHEMANDFSERVLIIEPEVITTRRTDQDVNTQRTETLPQILGAILDLVAQVLKHLPDVQATNLPRMADFARILAALDAATGWNTLPDYRNKVAVTGMNQIEGDTLARTVYFLGQRPVDTPGQPAWEGTSADLLGELRTIAMTNELPTTELPADVRVLGRRIREIAPSLRKVGVDVRQTRTNTQRTLSVVKLARTPDKDTSLSE
jgi:hypothetical protein